MPTKYNQKVKVYAALTREVAEMLDHDAEDAMRSRAAQIEYLLTKYYEEKLDSGIHNRKGGQHKIQD